MKQFNLSKKEKTILTKVYPKKKVRHYYNSEDIKQFIKTLKSNWREKCKRMKIMNSDVAIFELESEIDKLGIGDSTEVKT